MIVAVNDNVDSKEDSRLIIVDKNTLATKKAIVMERGFTIFKVNVNKDKVTLVSYDGDVKRFDKHFKEILSEKIPLNMTSDDEILEEVKISGDKIFALVSKFNRDKNGVLAKIVEYSLETKETNEFLLKADRDWEMTGFEVLK